MFVSKRKVFCGSVIATLLSGAMASAAVMSAEATTNATIRPTGPRTNGTPAAVTTSSFNVEGNGNGANASYALADFSGASFSFGGTVTAINSISLALTEFNAAFTAPGSYEVYLASNTTAVSVGTTPNYMAGNDGSASVGSQQGTLTLLSSNTFTTTGNINNGQIDTTTLTLTSSASNAVISAINSGSAFRLVVTPTTDATAATFAGATYTGTGSYAGPTLNIDAAIAATPEPASIGVLGVAGLLLVRRRAAHA